MKKGQTAKERVSISIVMEYLDAAVVWNAISKTLLFELFLPLTLHTLLKAPHFVTDNAALALLSPSVIHVASLET